MVEGEESITWWPSVLAQEIGVTHREVLDDGSRSDEMLKISVVTEVISTDDEEWALGAVIDANSKFPYGAYIYLDGRIIVHSSLALNPLNVPLLSLLHEAALVQAASALEFIQNLGNDVQGEVLISGHPDSGIREAPDELLLLYYGESCSLPIQEEAAIFSGAIRATRMAVKSRFEEDGKEIGFVADDVFFCNWPDMDIAIGELPDGDFYKKFGPGIDVKIRFLMPGYECPPSDINQMNAAVASFVTVSQLAPVLGDKNAVAYGINLGGYLGYAFLRGNSLINPNEFSEPTVLVNDVSVFNAIIHYVSAARGLINVLAQNPNFEENA